MNKVKQLYRDFFGLNEQAVKKHPVVPGLDKNDTVNLSNYNKELKKTSDLMKGMTSEEIDEATLDNSITEYRGGVQWVLIDPANAKRVMEDISQWAQKKGFTIIKRNISKSGKVGYIYFRLGDDPAKESQRIQGYVAQSPDIKHFRFKVLGEKPTPPQAPTPENI
jgi:hypothetical protein